MALFCSSRQLFSAHPPKQLSSEITSDSEMEIIFDMMPDLHRKAKRLNENHFEYGDTRPPVMTDLFDVT